MRQFLRVTLVTSLAVVMAACGGSKPSEQAQKQAEETAKSPEPGGGGLGSMAQGFEQLAKSAEEAAKTFENREPVDPVSFRDLQTVLPAMDGWEMDKPTGERMTSPVPFSRSEATYRKDEARIQVEVVDSGFNQMLVAPALMMLAAGYERETESGYEKVTKVGEFPAFEKWDNTSKDGELSIVVNRRFIVKVDGNSVADAKVLHDFAKATGLAKLAGMK
jgi:hypothetical protein